VAAHEKMGGKNVKAMKNSGSVLCHCSPVFNRLLVGKQERKHSLNITKIGTCEDIHYLSLSPWGTHKARHCESVCWKTSLVENQLVAACQKRA